MPLTPGTRLGPYEIVAPLGAGGMGEVHRAHDPRLGRDVAIKSLPAELGQDPERLARFSREAKLLASLSHPNIAGIHGLEEAGGARFLVLELVEGETLAARLARGPLPVDEAIQVCRQVAAGVEAAHEAGIVHRDLKPGNVMLRPDGTVKVLDFGLAKSGSPEGGGSSSSLSMSPTMTHAATSAGVILGTAAYMSPEQARGRSVDKRSDVWSFGCVLYECLTGRQAFSGETVSDMIVAILTKEPNAVALPPGTPARVRELLARCLCKDPRERLRDIGEARIVLGSAGAGADTAASAPLASPRGRTVPLWAAIAAALVLIGIAVVSMFFPDPQRSPAHVRKLDLVANDVKMDWFFSPQISPDGQRVAFIEREKLRVRDLRQLEPRDLATVDGLTPISWSPDSREIVYNDAGKLWKVSVEGVAPVVICEVPGTGTVVGATWSRSGRVAFSVWRGGMYEVPAAGGSPRLLFDIDPKTMIDYHAPSWLQNGDLMYVVHWRSWVDTAGRPRPTLGVSSGGRQDLVPPFGMPATGSPVLTRSGRLLFLTRDANAGIWSVRFDPRRRRVSGERELVAPGAASISVSEDGSLLYMERSDESGLHQLCWVDRAGRVVEEVGDPYPGLSDVALSPDGRRVAFTTTKSGNEDVWVHDLARGTGTRITFGERAESRPHWIGSSRLSFNTLDTMRSQLISVNADGSGGRRLMAPALGFGRQDATIAPDGRTALRLLDESGHLRLQVSTVGSDGVLGAPAPLPGLQPAPDVDDAWLSPDGQLVAYGTDDPGQPDVFLTRYPSGEGQWQVSTEGGRLPRWARSSGELFYIGGGGPSRRAMWSVTVDPSQDPPLGKATRLFDIEPNWLRFGEMPYDVSADGQRILMVRETAGSTRRSTRMVLVENWEAELASKPRP